VGESIQQVEKARLVPKEVSVSIGIPYHYYKEYWRTTTEANSDAVPTFTELTPIFTEVSQEVTQIVRPLILLPTTGEDIFDNIVVKPVLRIPPEEPLQGEGGEWYDPAKEWLIDQGNWQVLGMMLLGLVGLFVLRGMVKASATPSQDSPAALAAVDDPASSVVGGAVNKEEESAKPKRKFSSDGPNIKEELSELIQDDPDTAANVLKQWIGETV
jgi:flagellar M-ring protein FliF